MWIPVYMADFLPKITVNMSDILLKFGDIFSTLIYPYVKNEFNEFYEFLLTSRSVMMAQNIIAFHINFENCVVTLLLNNQIRSNISVSTNSSF